MIGKYVRALERNVSNSYMLNENIKNKKKLKGMLWGMFSHYNNFKLCKQTNIFLLNQIHLLIFIQTLKGINLEI